MEGSDKEESIKFKASLGYILKQSFKKKKRERRRETAVGGGGREIKEKEITGKV